MSSAEGVGALDACAAASLRDALFSAASDVHADAAAVLADAPPTTIFLRPSPGGDGGDLETHVAVALFWGVRRREREARAGTVGDAGEEASEAAETAEASRTVAVTSRFGVERALTATQLGAEIAERVAVDDRARALLVDARVAPGDSGVVRFLTAAHHDARRRDGFSRCKLCGRFVAGERALWWHSKTKHGIAHAEAVAEAENESRALFVARPPRRGTVRDAGAAAAADVTPGSAGAAPAREKKSVRAPSDLAAGLAAARRGDPGALAALVSSGKVEALADPGLDAARRGDARALRELLLEKKWDPRGARDRHGAGALLWSAGAGHLACVRLLCEEAPPGCAPLDPSDPATHQTGRRAYRGRTALHWAARNGHLDVVRYLVTEKNVDADARTFEGTTAFGWAVWRGRLEVARWLVEKGKCAFSAVNTFGCNAAMWCAQGAEEDRDEREAEERDGGGAGARDASAGAAAAAETATFSDDADVPPTAAYVASLGVSFRLINANGHGVVHKAAQRGRRDMCAFLLGNRWPRGRDAPRRPGERFSSAAREGGRSERFAAAETPETPESPNARALVDANHLRRDDEGFRPSDLARLAGDAALSAWLVAVEKAYDEEEADAEAAAASPPRSFRETYTYETYPPTTFYGAASLGDVSLLARILRTDVYGVNDDIAGFGSVLHVAVARGHVELVSAIARGAISSRRVDVNRKSSGAFFGLTPLHVAATLFTRREAFAQASRVLERAQTELERLRARDRGPSDGAGERAFGAKEGGKKKAGKREEKRDAKKQKRAAHANAAEARKVLAVDAAGACDAARIYRILLQAGADVRAVAKVPAAFVGPKHRERNTRPAERGGGDAGPRDERLVSATPRDLAGAAAAAEVAALELEVAEAPPALFHRLPSTTRGSRSVSDASGFSAPRDGPPRTPPPRPPPPTAASDPGDEKNADPTRLFRAGVAEAEARRGAPTRAEVPGVPGAFVLDQVLGPEACASLCAVVDRLVDGAAAEAEPRAGDGVGGTERKALPSETRLRRNAPRRESAASRAERLASSRGTRESLETYFLSATRDPLSLVAATTTPDGATNEPVTPACWDAPAEGLKELAARCRPFLPSAGSGASRDEAFAATLAPAGFELATHLRCYRYDPGTASPPHFDKAGPGAKVADGRETKSGYTVVVYLNGDDFANDASLGGETTFFRPLGDRDAPARSRRGLTVRHAAVGDGAAPLTRVSARVRGRTGAALFFPHGTVSRCFESPLHEGSAVRGNAAKYVLRTDVCYFA